MAMMSPELAEHYDFFGFDPRGVGESDGVVCSYVPDEDHTTWEDDAARVPGCMEDPLAPFINTEQTAYDMDFIRAPAMDQPGGLQLGGGPVLQGKGCPRSNAS
ncbi:hypothetical protein [Ornithinimicrobium panacihumi]|uniref:hypothetical protein n=1 Tax=Ornithinimicrobium panacihumi TaxID=2008449 RepID=UPI003F8AA497